MFALRGVGYVPLVSAYRAYRRGPAASEALLESCGVKLPEVTSEAAS
jgi:hypothetical protein